MALLPVWHSPGSTLLSQLPDWLAGGLYPIPADTAQSRANSPIYAVSAYGKSTELNASWHVPLLFGWGPAASSSATAKRATIVYQRRVSDVNDAMRTHSSHIQPHDIVTP